MTSRTALACTVDTPIGPFSTVTDAGGVVLASGWTATTADLLPLVSPSLRPTEIDIRPDLGEVSKAVLAYHDGDLAAVAEIPVRQRSGPFRQHAWDVLRDVPPGRPVSYQRYAALAGRPTAVRAAAGACAYNAAALFVPCHRVLRSDGGLGGFRWGLDIKRWLLDHEVSGAVNATAPEPVTNAEMTRVLGSVLHRPTLLPVPRFGPKILLGGELAEALLFTSQRVLPGVLTAQAFPFAHPTLEGALRSLLDRPLAA